ncbi:hypothetical protein M514_08508, partial [Trichuris suis]
MFIQLLCKTVAVLWLMKISQSLSINSLLWLAHNASVEYNHLCPFHIHHSATILQDVEYPDSPEGQSFKFSENRRYCFYRRWFIVLKISLQKKYCYTRRKGVRKQASEHVISLRTDLKFFDIRLSASWIGGLTSAMVFQRLQLQD